jgi:hypothetical protein
MDVQKKLDTLFPEEKYPPEFQIVEPITQEVFWRTEN